MKKLIPLLLFLVFSTNLAVKAQTLHFDEYIYIFNNKLIPKNELITKEYYIQAENNKNWTSRFVISEIKVSKSVLKIASEEVDKIEKNENLILLKFIQNRSQKIAIISYLENFEKENKIFFIYNIKKFEKAPQNKIVTITYQKKYQIKTNLEAKKMIEEIKKVNNDYIERMIITQIPELE